MRHKKEKEIIFMDKYRLTADSMNIILQEKQIVTGEGKRPLTASQVGDIHWLNIAYFATVENALYYVIEKEIKEKWTNDLKELSKEVETLHKAVRDLTLDLSLDKRTLDPDRLKE